VPVPERGLHVTQVQVTQVQVTQGCRGFAASEVGTGARVFERTTLKLGRRRPGFGSIADR